MAGRKRVKRETPSTPPPGYQPSMDELEADLRIPATPDDLLDAVMGQHPRSPSEETTS